MLKGIRSKGIRSSGRSLKGKSLKRRTCTVWSCRVTGHWWGRCTAGVGCCGRLWRGSGQTGKLMCSGSSSSCTRSPGVCSRCAYTVPARQGTPCAPGERAAACEQPWWTSAAMWAPADTLLFPASFLLSGRYTDPERRPQHFRHLLTRSLTGESLPSVPATDNLDPGRRWQRCEFLLCSLSDDVSLYCPATHLLSGENISVSTFDPAG
mmetsp:Transcript_20327/g.61248  ORF Transcript_20327/g.61248 Transcript_20327/m.61248 type:complete len:208 (+) Transcript_20327:1192-1815(+)